MIIRKSKIHFWGVCVPVFLCPSVCVCICMLVCLCVRTMYARQHSHSTHGDGQFTCHIVWVRACVFAVNLSSSVKYCKQTTVPLPDHTLCTLGSSYSKSKAVRHASVVWEKQVLLLVFIKKKRQLQTHEY